MLKGRTVSILMHRKHSSSSVAMSKNYHTIGTSRQQPVALSKGREDKGTLEQIHSEFNKSVRMETKEEDEIKKAFGGLWLGREISWENATLKRDPHADQQSNPRIQSKTRRQRSVDEVLGNVQHHMLMWINSTESTTDFNNIVSAHSAINDFHEFSDDKQANQYKVFLHKFESIVAPFNSSLYNKVDDHVCYFGPRDEAQLSRILKTEFEGAEDDLEMLQENDGNIFTPLMKDLVILALQRIIVLYEKDNKGIVSCEEKLIDESIKIILQSYVSVLERNISKLITKNALHKMDEVSKRLVQDCIKALRYSSETHEKINAVMSQGSDILRKRMQKAYKSQQESLGLVQKDLPSSSRDVPQNTKQAATNVQKSADQKLGPVILYVNRSFDVEVAILKSPGAGATFLLAGSENKRLVVPGQVAFTKHDSTFHVGEKANDFVQHANNRTIHFWLLFELVCNSGIDTGFREIATSHYFFSLKQYIGDRQSAIIILPEWVPDEGRKFLKRVLETNVFAGVKLLHHATSIAAGYFMRRNSEVAVDTNACLLTFTAIHGFIQVKVYGLDFKSSTGIPVVCLGTSNNRREIVAKLFPWFLNDRHNAGTLTQLSWNSAVEMLNQARGMVRDRTDRNWLASVDCLVVTNDANWKSQLESTLAVHGNVVTCVPTEWENLLIQGASLYAFKGSPDFDKFIFGKFAPQPGFSKTDKQLSGSGVPTYSPGVKEFNERKKALKVNCQHLLEFINSQAPNSFPGEKDGFISDIQLGMKAAGTATVEEDVMENERRINSIHKKLGYPFRTTANASLTTSL